MMVEAHSCLTFPLRKVVSIANLFSTHTPIWASRNQCVFLGPVLGLLHWIQLLEVLPYRTSFTLNVLVSWVKVFRLLSLEMQALKKI
jgi:hypothetical protein